MDRLTYYRFARFQASGSFLDGDNIKVSPMKQNNRLSQA
jgi:hypothetical protein